MFQLNCSSLSTGILVANGVDGGRVTVVNTYPATIGYV